MERALIVGVNISNSQSRNSNNRYESFNLAIREMVSLAKACEMEVVGQVEQNMENANTATYIGPGKVVEVREAAKALEADIVIFDNGLSPIQLRNLQNELDCPVMDRTTLILEIFSTRARTREAKLQVEVARLQYMLPRLVGLHDALSRQGGASGAMSNKGSGEKKLELDRRRLEHRLTSMKRELESIAGERETQRKKRAESGIPRVALVGYTNAGKSTIMNMFLNEYVDNFSFSYNLAQLNNPASFSLLQAWFDNSEDSQNSISADVNKTDVKNRIKDGQDLTIADIVEHDSLIIK